MTIDHVFIRIFIILLAIAAPLVPAADESQGTVLITGANRGIGLALAERFGRAGYEVIGTARSPEKAAELRALGARVEQLDVASQASVDALAVDLGKQGLIFVALHPGYVQTEMNDGKGNYTPEESAAGLYEVINGLQPSDNGRFYDFKGKQLPW